MKLTAAVCASLLCACSFPAAPTLLPPPYGPITDNPEPARFFFPTGIAIDRAGKWVVVTNSNADRLYDTGATYSFRASDLLPYFDTTPPSECTVSKQGSFICPFPTAALAGTVISGNYTGPLVVAGNNAYAASRDTGRLNAVVIDQNTGSLACPNDPGSVDCRGASVDLKNLAQLEGPFGIATAEKVRRPDGGPEFDAVLVSALVPHLDAIQTGTVLTSSRLAAVDQGNLSVQFSATATTSAAGGFGAGPMVFDDRAREAILAGCYTRFGSASAGGELSTLKCGATANGVNLLRFVPVDAGADARARVVDLGSQLHSVDSTGLELGDVDPVSGLRRLYMTTRAPDTVVRIGLPSNPAFVPVVEAVVPISSQPSLIVRLQRPPGTTGPELLAISGVATYEMSTIAGKLIIFDGLSGRVVGQVDNIGDTPFALAQFPPTMGEKIARLAITLFGSCSVALVDVPYDDPSGARLRANLGSCPP